MFLVISGFWITPVGYTLACLNPNPVYFSNRQKSRHHLLLSFIKVSLLMSLREFKIIFQMQYFKGNNFICITTRVAFL